MKKTYLATVPLLCLAMMTVSCAGIFGKGGEPEPTAIVVDAETGKPIEGAVGLAVWWSEAAVGGFEGGGVPVTRRVETSISDEKGRIYIDDFWDWHFFKSSAPHLTVYRCGYVCWNRYYLFGGGERYDFDMKNRIVRLERWPEDFSFLKHDQFISSFVTEHGRLGRIMPFYEAYDGCEKQGYIDERTEENKRRKRDRKKKKLK